MAIEATPEGVLAFEPSWSDAATETAKVVDVVCDSSGLTVLVGGVVSINHEVETDPEPGLPYVSLTAPASP